MLTRRQEAVRWHITRAIAKNPNIPAEREKRAMKIQKYITQEMERENRPEEVASTIRDMQEQIHALIIENRELKRRPRWKTLLTKS